MTQYAKAAVALAGALGIALADDAITTAEWCAIAATVAGVFAVPNKTADNEDGVSDFGLLATVIIAALIVCIVLPRFTR